MLKNISRLSVFILLMFVSINVSAQPKLPPLDIDALLGFYQSEGENIVVRERGGRLELLYGVTEQDYAFDQANVYQMRKVRYNDYGLVVGNPRDYKTVLDVKFERDNQGRGITCIIDRKRYTRIFFLGENNNDFVVEPSKPIEELKSVALVAEQPAQSAQLLIAQLVDVVKLDLTIKLDMPYATGKNFLKSKIYETDKAFLEEQTAQALVRVNKKLAVYGYGIVIWDAYRPWHLTKLLHDALPEDKKYLLETAEAGSPHNKGLSVDVTLYDLNTGEVIKMISEFDEMAFKTYKNYQGGNELSRYRRDLLRSIMESEGFTGIDHEWWHFDFKDFNNYKLLNIKFDEIQNN